MLNEDYLPCLRALFKVDVESAVNTFFDHKQNFHQLNWGWAQGSGHISPLDLTEEAADTFQTARCLRRPHTTKYGPRIVARKGTAAGHIKTSFHLSTRTRATQSPCRIWPNMDRLLCHKCIVLSGSPLHPNGNCFKKVGFKTLWAITLTGVNYKKLEGTKKNPCKTTTPTQRHKISVDRSKVQNKQPCKTTTAVKGHGTKVQWP